MSLDLTDDKSTLVQVMAITWANVDPDLCRHMASLGHSELSNNSQHLWYHDVLLLGLIELIIDSSVTDILSVTVFCMMLP